MTILLLKSFLENRKQFVKLNDDRSSIEPINCGVPQGSQLAAPLYIIFINDIFKIQLNGEIQLYADDIVIVYSCKTRTDLKKQMQEDLTNLEIYFNENLLIINEKN